MDGKIKLRNSRCDKTAMANTFEYFTGLKGFYVYSNTVNCKPHIGQKISFKLEHNNNYNKFAVAGRIFLKG